MSKTYNEELISMLQDCSNWEKQEKALKEAFNRGIGYQQQIIGQFQQGEKHMLGKIILILGRHKSLETLEQVLRNMMDQHNKVFTDEYLKTE